MKTTFDIKGYQIKITIHADTDHGAPWEENDGHGIVSGWERRAKRAGELILCTDRGASRFYDFAGTMKIAKRDGWGLAESAVAALAAKLGRAPSKGEIFAQAVQKDFDYLRGWANDLWHYQGYTTEIVTPDGETLDGDSCWGFDDENYMMDEARGNAVAFVNSHIETAAKTEIAACVP
jgi:hypothetical protein